MGRDQRRPGSAVGGAFRQLLPVFIPSALFMADFTEFPSLSSAQASPIKSELRISTGTVSPATEVKMSGRKPKADGTIEAKTDAKEMKQGAKESKAETKVEATNAEANELEAELNHDFDREDVATVGGLVLAEFGRVPRSGEQIRVNGYDLFVEQVLRRRVKRVSVRRVRGEPPAESLS